MRRSAAKEGSIVEIACDESGFSGGNLVGPGASTVFAHAGVHVDERSAGLALAEIRASLQARSDGEYKSAELMRARHRPLLLSFLGPSGPIAGRATVIVIDTRFFVLARLLDVLLGVGPAAPTELPGRDPGTHQMADRLYRSGAETYGAADWQEFLQLAGNLLRTNSRWLPARPVENFYATLDRLLATDRSGEVAEVLDRLRSSRPIAEQVRSGYLANAKQTPLFEPIIPAVARTVAAWTAVTSEVHVVHDEQSALTPERLTDIAVAVARSRPGTRLAGFRLVDSRLDPRIQLADFLAGVAHRHARGVLRGEADPEVTRLLRPMIDPESLWVAAGPPPGDGPGPSPDGRLLAGPVRRRLHVGVQSGDLGIAAFQLAEGDEAEAAADEPAEVAAVGEQDVG